MRIEIASALIVSMLLLMLPFAVTLDGKPHANWQQFLGRFHPLAVHLPIGLLLLVPVLEVAGIYRAAMREAAGFVLALALLACLGSLTLGYVLAYGSGNISPVITRHMWGGITLCIAVMGCLLARALWSAGSLPRLYPLALCATLFLLAWTAHQGGSITYGSGYLTRYLPASLKVLTRTQSADTGRSFFVTYIHPVLADNCVTCHGESKTEGGLRLDSYEALMKGGKDGPVIVAAHPEQSLLLTRVTLPSTHKDFMPADGRPPLQQEQIAWIRAWVQQGALATAENLTGIAMAPPRTQPTILPVADYSTLLPEIRQMAAAQGAKLQFVSSKPSDGLILNTADISASFNDDQLAQFAKFAPYIVEANLARTAVTDAGLATIATFTHLRTLHLEDSKVKGSGLEKLASLKELTYVNLGGTGVTADAVKPLRARGDTLHLYLYNTPAEPLPEAAHASEVKGVETSQ